MFGMYQVLLNNKKGDMIVIERQRDKQASSYKEKGEECKHWAVKGDKTRTDLKTGSTIILSQKEHRKYEHAQDV